MTPDQNKSDNQRIGIHGNVEQSVIVSGEKNAEVFGGKFKRHEPILLYRCGEARLTTHRLLLAADRRAFVNADVSAGAKIRLIANPRIKALISTTYSPVRASHTKISAASHDYIAHFRSER